MRVAHGLRAETRKHERVPEPGKRSADGSERGGHGHSHEQQTSRFDEYEWQCDFCANEAVGELTE